MTTHQAQSLAATIEHPEIAPVCECGKTKKKRLSGYGDSHGWICYRCKNRKYKARRKRLFGVDPMTAPLDPGEPAPLCEKCSYKLTWHGPNAAHVNGQWRCYRCQYKAKKATKAERRQAIADGRIESTLTDKACRDYWRAWKGVKQWIEIRQFAETLMEGNNG